MKLRRHEGVWASCRSSAGCWQTLDGKYLILAEHQQVGADGHAQSMSPSWQVEFSLHGLTLEMGEKEFNQELESRKALLIKSGLVEARFSTRRAAATALEGLLKESVSS